MYIAAISRGLSRSPDTITQQTANRDGFLGAGNQTSTKRSSDFSHLTVQFSLIAYVPPVFCCCVAEKVVYAHDTCTRIKIVLDLIVFAQTTSRCCCSCYLLLLVLPTANREEVDEDDNTLVPLMSDVGLLWYDVRLKCRGWWRLHRGFGLFTTRLVIGQGKGDRVFHDYICLCHHSQFPFVTSKL